jgi:hypothetical protein
MGRALSATISVSIAVSAVAGIQRNQMAIQRGQ